MCEIDECLVEGLSEFCGQFALIAVTIDELGAVRSKEVGCALDEDVNSSLVVLINGSHLLPLWTEGEDLDDMVFWPEFLVVVAHSISHLQECTLCLITDLFDGDGSFLVGDDGVGVRVVTDRQRQDFGGMFRDNICLHWLVHPLLDEDLCHSHEVLGESACFVWADVVGSAHSLAGLEVSNQIVLLFHLTYRVSQGDSYWKWQSFRHSHDDNTNSNDEVLDHLVKGLDREECFHEVLLHETVVDVVDEHGHESGCGWYHAYLSYLVS